MLASAPAPLPARSDAPFVPARGGNAWRALTRQTWRWNALNGGGGCAAERAAWRCRRCGAARRRGCSGGGAPRRWRNYL